MIWILPWSQVFYIFGTWYIITMGQKHAEYCTLSLRTFDNSKLFRCLMLSVQWRRNLTVPIDRDEDCGVLSNFTEYIQYSHILWYCWSTRTLRPNGFVRFFLSVKYQSGSGCTSHVITTVIRHCVCAHENAMFAATHHDCNITDILYTCMGKLEVTLHLLKKCMKLIYILLELKRLVDWQKNNLQLFLFIYHFSETSSEKKTHIL